MTPSARPRTLAAAALATLAGAALAAPPTNLVVNGNFETGSGVGQIGSVVTGTGWTNTTVFNGFDTVTAFNFINDTRADDALSGTVGGFPSENSPTAQTNIFVWGPDNGVNNGFTGSSNGGRFLAGDGGYATGSVSQTISGLTVGQAYDLTFEWAGAQFTDVTGAYWVGWNVSFGSQSQSVGGASTGAVASRGFLPWRTAAMTFTATATSQALTFLATGPNGLPPLSLLDGVSLTVSSVPEPQTLALMAAGLGTLLLRARRSRQPGPEARQS